jgi:hypothetical protein
MQRIMTRFLMVVMAVGFVACSKSKTGNVDQLEVFEPITLTSTDDETMVLNPGSQPAGQWLLKYNGKKNPPLVALKDKRTDSVYPINTENFTSDVKFLSSVDATTPWEDRYESCWREVYQTVCGRFSCWTQVTRIPGSQQVRERQVGSYDTYETNVMSKSGSKVAYVKFTFNETTWESQALSMCF